jgi:hypothetical protein
MTTQTSLIGDSGTLAVRYIAEQLRSTRSRLRRTRIISIVVALVVLGYLSFITYTLKKEYLAPKSAAAMVNLQLSGLISANAPALTAELKLQIPALIASIPDRIIEQLPALRSTLESQLEDLLRAYCLETGQQLAAHLDDFLTENKDAINAFVEAAEHPEGVAVLGERFEDELTAYLKTKGADGKSIQDKMDQVLAELKQIDGRLDRLVNAKDLSPEEKRLRYAIAVTMKSAAHEVGEITP